MIINTEWGAFGEQGELDFILTRSENTFNPIGTCTHLLHLFML